MRTEYKVIKPFGCAKIGDIFNFDSDDREFVMEDTRTTKKVLTLVLCLLTKNMLMH